MCESVRETHCASSATLSCFVHHPSIILLLLPLNSHHFITLRLLAVIHPLFAERRFPHRSASTRAMAVTVNKSVATSTGTKRKAAPHDVDSAAATQPNKRKTSTRKPAPEVQSAAASEEHKNASADVNDVDGSAEQSVLNIPLIRRYEKEAIASKQHINHITTLLDHIQQQQQQPSDSHSFASSASLHTTTAAYQSLYRILEHYVEAGELQLGSAPGGSTASLAGQLRQWLHSLYDRYVECSLLFLDQPHSPLQLSAFHALMALVRLSTAALSADAAASLLSTGNYASAIDALLASSHYAAVHETLLSQYLLQHVDLRVFALRAIKANIKQAVRHSNHTSTTTDSKLPETNNPTAASSLSETTLDNTLTLLLALSTPDTPDTPAPTTSFTNATVSPSALANTLSATYLAFLSLPHTPATYKRILEHLDSHILPNVSNPLLLADFLTDSYHIGGIVSLLSLAALFHLIATYNLDYPHFYHKLYTLCTPQLTLSKHRHKLFTLLSKFLSSAYLPQSLVAAFCKRLARLAVMGGCGVDGSMELMRLVWGLVRRNRSVRGMLWGQQEVEKDKEAKMESLTDFLLKRQTELAVEGEKREEQKAELGEDGESAQHDDIFDDNLSDDDDEPQPVTTNGVNGNSGKSARIDPLTAIQSASLTSTATTSTTSNPASSFTTDPFLPLVDDPAACNASASTLWELRTLTHHYAPAVRSLAQLFYAENAPKGEVDMVGVGKVGESDGYDGMMRKEMERRKNQKVAVNYGKRAKLVEEGEIITSNFTWS